MIYRILKSSSLLLIIAAACMSGVNLCRDATVLHNPTGVGINVMLLIFLTAGAVFIYRTPRAK